MSLDTFIFDIDHTLYPFSQGVEDWFAQTIHKFIAENLSVTLDEAALICEDYYQTFGSTLTGLMYHNNISPARFIAHKGGVPLKHIDKITPAMQAVKAINKRKIAFTNASHAHGERVLAHLGIREEFEGLYGLDDVGFWGKPFHRSFDYVFQHANITPKNAVFFEDSPRNLAYPHKLGVTTVLIGEQFYAIGQAPSHISLHKKTLLEAIEAVNAL